MISLRNVDFYYRKKQVINGLSLDLEPGNIYGLLGGNGQGKSTLLRLICGLLFPKTGTIGIGTEQPSKRQPELLQKIMLLPEDITAPALTPEAYAKYFSVFYPNFDPEMFTRFLEELEVPKTQLMSEMSLGQKKKALIAFSLACNTDILLMDEPTNGLDIISKSKFRKLIASQMQSNRIIVVSTHQVKDLEQLIDRILVLNDQKIIFNESIPEIGKKLLFTIVNNVTEQETVIYEENSLKGISIVAENNTGNDSKVDLELLYKALQYQPSMIRSLFNSSKN